MARIISTHSFRGGTGKSNTTANLATLVARAGHRVGVIDTDIQSPGIHVVFGFDQSQAKWALNDYLWKKCPIESAAYDITEQSIGKATPGDERPRLYLIPSSLNSGEIARILREGYDVGMLNDGSTSSSSGSSSITCSSTHTPASTRRRCCRSRFPMRWS
ncbi:MAG TPA: P-loop NTPase [Planctomycetaceae bacterium]|nr:P-loop NTPase [Planctomycetaceae bacterium]